MASQADGSLNSLADACSRARVPMAPYAWGALLVVVVGVQSLLGVSWRTLQSRISLHALFALLLCGLVLARYRGHVKHSPSMLPADTRELSRHLSRIVYLLLYVVIGVRQVIGVFCSLWRGDAADFNLFDERFRSSADSAGFDLRDDFRLLVVSGLLALILARVLTFRLWPTAVEHTALSTATEVHLPRVQK